jgi:hypothetical protein
MTPYMGRSPFGGSYDSGGDSVSLTSDMASPHTLADSAFGRPVQSAVSLTFYVNQTHPFRLSDIEALQSCPDSAVRWDSEVMSNDYDDPALVPAAWYDQKGKRRKPDSRSVAEGIMTEMREEGNDSVINVKAGRDICPNLPAVIERARIVDMRAAANRESAQSEEKQHHGVAGMLPPVAAAVFGVGALVNNGPPVSSLSSFLAEPRRDSLPVQARMLTLTSFVFALNRNVKTHYETVHDIDAKWSAIGIVTHTESVLDTIIESGLPSRMPSHAVAGFLEKPGLESIMMINVCSQGYIDDIPNIWPGCQENDDVWIEIKRLFWTSGDKTSQEEYPCAKTNEFRIESEFDPTAQKIIDGLTSANKASATEKWKGWCETYEAEMPPNREANTLRWTAVARFGTYNRERSSPKTTFHIYVGKVERVVNEKHTTSAKHVSALLNILLTSTALMEAAVHITALKSRLAIHCRGRHPYRY